MEQRPNTPKRQWSPQRAPLNKESASSPVQCESPSLHKSNNARVESPFSSQPNPYLPKPLSPIKMETPNNVKPVQNNQNQNQPEEVLSRQQRELIHQQEVLDQIRRSQRWQQPSQNVQQQQLQQQQEQQFQQHLQQQRQQREMVKTDLVHNSYNSLTIFLTTGTATTTAAVSTTTTTETTITTTVTTKTTSTKSNSKSTTSASTISTATVRC